MTRSRWGEAQTSRTRLSPPLHARAQSAFSHASGVTWHVLPATVRIGGLLFDLRKGVVRFRVTL
jgi:hypothetical protein